MPEHPNAPEQRTIDVDVRDIDTRGRTLHGYASVYGAESGDLGGFTERIAPGAFRDVLASPELDVRALLNHDANAVLGRSRSGTLRLADDERGLRFELDLPESPLGENVRASVARGDIDGASFRFRVGRDSWEGSRRVVETVSHLADVTVATFGAYPAASVELRTRPAVDQPLETAVPENETDNRSAPDRVAVALVLNGVFILLVIALMEVRRRGSEVGAFECQTRCTDYQEVLSILGILVLPLATVIFAGLAFAALCNALPRSVEHNEPRDSN